MAQSKVTQIRIGSRTVGFVGLHKVFEDMAATYDKQSEAVVAKELLRRLAQKNYIPDAVQEEYRRAFVREFKKFLGQPVENDHPGGLEIKILGAGCAVCDGMESEVMDVLSELQLPVDVEHVRDTERIAKYNIKATPALLINGKVMVYGRRPSKQDVRKWLQQIQHPKSSGGNMDKPILIKNIPFSEPHDLLDLVAYEEGRVVSRTFAQNSSISLTLFSFPENEGVSTHTAPGDAMVQVLDGEALINIDGKEMAVCSGQVVVMPADVPHSVFAKKRFKMLLTVIKRPKFDIS